MIIDSSFTVAAPPDEVYQLMLDVEKVAPCIPGAHVLGAREDGSYDAEVKIKLGPVSMTYRGTVKVEEHDDAARTAKLRAKGNEARGQGTAQAVMSMGVDSRPTAAARTWRSRPTCSSADASPRWARGSCRTSRSG